MGQDMADGEHISDMLTVREVARLLHVHPNTLRRWSNAGRIKSYRITRRGDRRFKREEIAHFLAELNSQAGNWQKTEIRQQSH
jgi:excisionase family DNA binding protein